MQQYKHRSLDTKSKQIRLLRIEKETHGQQIVLSLRHALLDDGEAFNALSYAWGEEDAIHDIVICDGDETGSFSIRPNLYDFLTTAHNSQGNWTTEWIWIDQICIDQGHHEEKCYQVAQMAKLYSTAMATIVWPGLTYSLERHDQSYGNPSTLLFDINDLEIIGSTPVQLRASRESLKIPSMASINLLSMVTELMLHDLMRSPYWSRLWVIQEVALASQVQIVIAGRTWELDDFGTAICSLVENQKCVKSIRAACNDLEDLLLLERLLVRLSWIDLARRSVLKLRGSPSWAWILPFVKGMSCTLPLDRVYAVMALVHKDLRLYPDYTIGSSQLLQKILEKQIAFPQPHSILVELFQMIDSWTGSLGFEPPESVRVLLTQIRRARCIDSAADYTEARKLVVRLALEELDLTWPTLILRPRKRLYWRAALEAVYISYAQALNTEADTAYDPAFNNIKDDVLGFISLQRHFIETASVQDDEGTVGRLSNTMCRRKSFSTIAAHNAGERKKNYKFERRQKSVPDIVCGLAGPGDFSSHLPKRLIELLLLDLKHQNVAGNYDTGIPWD